MNRALKVIPLLLVLASIAYLAIPTDAAFWSLHYAVNQIGTTPTATLTATPTATGTPTATATGSPSATPTPGGLSAAVTALMGDVGNGNTNPIVTMCKTKTVSASGGSPNGFCTAAGSVSVAGIPTDGTDAGSAFQTAINAGDINLPAATYTINTAVAVPSWRTIQCQPGATITTTNTTGNIFTLGSQDTIVACNFTGPGSGTAHAISQTGGQYDNIIGNSFSGFTTGNAVTFTGGTLHLIELNLFNINGLSTTGTTHTMTAYNSQNGTLSPNLPNVSVGSAGTKLQRDLWTVLNILSAGSASSSGFNTVSPGASFGGNTCSMNDSGNDTLCVQSALTSSANGIIVTPGTGANPYVRIASSDVLSGSNVSGKSIICQPGARFHYPGNTGTGSTPLHQFNIGWSLSGGTNINFVGCQWFGDYSDPTVYLSGGRYNEIVEFGMQQSPLSTNINGIGMDLENCWGDCWIPYASNNSSTSGPNDINLMFSKVFQSNQVGIHDNGGQGLHNVFDAIADADSGPEVDVPTLQVVGTEFDNIYYYSINGLLNNQNNVWRHPQLGCSDRQNAGANYGNCYMHDAVSDGTPASNPGVSGGKWVPEIEVQLIPVSGCIPGHYSGIQALGGGLVDSPNNGNC